MNVLVTGATGFLGSHMVKELVKEGHHVIIFKRSSSNCRRIAQVLPYLCVYNLDKTGIDVPFQEIGEIHAVIHTATCYGRDNESMAEIAAANISFPLQLLETAVAYGTKTFFNTDTFSNTGSLISNYLPGYHLSKKHFLEWGRYFSETKGIRFINMKLEHLYGPLDSEQKFIPKVINSCLNNEPELLLSPGEQKRDFIYLDDAISAYLVLLDKTPEQTSSFYEYQVGTGVSTSIRDLVELIHRVTRSRTLLKFGAIPYRDNEIMFSQAVIDPLVALGWVSKVGLEAGIETLIQIAKGS
ncbi:NAD-dependent epimerase/dehydratase family protein [Paenibacillus alkalitolerans]|uniref:NAD-dependent epimerase/dehydratase family protein n=1 Tax=Paenibacillus alkalitolerans TaxID=2799335 RepID=UPI0018F5F307|nr:NAD-dependent epimerase/dehydratase family protein [Paenibacillus alkalitolerans]